MILVDTGARCHEVGGLRYNPDDSETNDIGLDSGIFRMRGKGRRERATAIGRKTELALDRYQ